MKTKVIIFIALFISKDICANDHHKKPHYKESIKDKLLIASSASIPCILLIYGLFYFTKNFPDLIYR